MYQKETELVEDFGRLVMSACAAISMVALSFEFAYASGRVDVIGMSRENELFAFEAKLVNWRKALNQAYRATTFSHYAYVVLPEKVAKRAVAYAHEFEKRNVGLYSVTPSGLQLEIPAKRTNPLQPWVTTTACNSIL